MANISFFLTTPQFINGTKDVTRRLGWKNLKGGTRLTACEKCQGRKKGEPLNKLGTIIVTHVSRQPLDRMIDHPKWGNKEAIREGFPEMSGKQFVEMFTKEMKCEPSTEVTRIEFIKEGAQ